MNNIANAYILTKEGKYYSPKGIQTILKILRNDLHCTKDVNICQGKMYNNIPFLVNELKSPTDSYIFISTDIGIGILEPDQIEGFCNYLNKYPEANAWDVASEDYYHSMQENKNDNA